MPWWGWLIISILVACVIGLLSFIIYFFVQFAKGMNW